MENNNNYSNKRLTFFSIQVLVLFIAISLTACSSGGDGDGGNPQKPQLVQTPSVIGSNETEAVESINELDLEVTIIRTNANGPIGEILEQDPPAGEEIEVGQPVTITVSDGVSVPELVGMTLDEASQVIADSNLNSVLTFQNDISPINEVINQSVTSNTNVNPGTEIMLVVSIGVAVPNIIGLSSTDATTALTSLGFVVVENRINNTEIIGTVINQNHASGTNLNFGSTITITVSNGITVPNLIGQDLQNARTTLSNMGFTVVETRINNNEPVDRIIDQNPLANTNVNAGTPVTLVVSDGILVPLVIGSTQTQAINTLANLEFNVIVEQVENEAPINEVVNQDPAAGTNQTHGSAITIFISRGIAVPVVVNMSRDSAIAELTSRRLGFNEIRMNNPAPIDTVFGQSLSGQYVNAGTVVDIDVSDGLVVPDVISMNVNDATSLLRSLGFLVETSTVEDPAQVPDQVFNQNPASGTRTNGAVTVTLSVYVDSTTACVRDFTSLVAQINLASATRGGRLYDNWWTEAGSTAPVVDHPLWDTRDQPDINTRAGSDTWRCKECHGWDYKGVDGVFGDTANSHYTGFPGVMAARDKQPIDVFCAIHSGDGIDSNHNFSNALSNISIMHLTKFLITTDSDGLVDTSTVIDPSGVSLGSNTTGQTLYLSQIGCSSSNCHGLDGTAQHQPLGTLSKENPWQVLHKIRYGQPGAIMPAYADPNSTVQFSLAQIADVIAYTQTLSETTQPPPTPAKDLDIIARGGRLYDNWVSETGAPVPPINNPIWALQSTNTRTGADTWRCKECHGWDYKGVNGVYGNTSNSHYTGFGGVFNTEKTEAELVQYLTNGFIYAPTGTIMHSFDGMISATDIEAVAKFIKQGTVDTSIYIGPSGIINGSAQNFLNGSDLYSFKGFGVVNGNCALCHGLDGKGEPGTILGLAANSDPWSFLHKVRFGQPNTAMPALINQIDPLTGTPAFDIQDSVDITHYSQSLPQQ
jgi:beta-lactam-binding protein with PASTA domain/mono/diheme cytochrome c family protein